VTVLLDDLRGRLFLKVAEVAELMNVDPRTVRRAIDAGGIQAVRTASAVRVPAAPFWLQCGLDPQTLQPLALGEHQPGTETQNEADLAPVDLADDHPALGAHRDPESALRLTG